MNNDIQKITEYLFQEVEPEPSDLIFVFGTRHMDKPVKLAESLYHKEMAPRIMVSGGVNRFTGELEAEKMAALLVGAGVKSKDILLEKDSTNSMENAQKSAQVIEETLGWENISRVLVVCKNYHARRALMTLKKQWPKHVKCLPVIYSLDGIERDNWQESEEGRKKVMGEYGKIPKYLAQGDIQEL